MLVGKDITRNRNLGLLIAIVWALLSIARAGGQEPKPEPAKQPEATSAKTKTTIVADNRFGEGGTLESTSNEKLQIIREEWKDKDGKGREVHNFEDGTENWLLYTPAGRLYKH